MFGLVFGLVIITHAVMTMQEEIDRRNGSRN